MLRVTRRLSLAATTVLTVVATAAAVAVVAQDQAPVEPVAPRSAQPRQSGVTEGLGLWGLRVDYQGGEVAPPQTGSRDHFNAARVELVRQTDGSADWHHFNRFPSYGVGAYVGDFGSGAHERGTPAAVYWFFSVPIIPVTGSIDVVTTFGSGVAFGWNAPREDEDPFVRRPTSQTTSYVDWGLSGRFIVSRRLTLAGGVSVSHFSNGGARRPNHGFSFLAPRVSLEYALGERRVRPRRVLGPFAASWETRVAATFGVKGVGLVPSAPMGPLTDRSKLGIGNVKGSFWRRFYRGGQVGGGLEVSFYAPREEPRSVGHGVGLGAYGGYEQLFGPLSFFLHIGRHVWRDRDDTRPMVYQRFGTRYQLTDHVFGMLAVRFHSFTTSDFLEWGLGYRFGSLPFMR